MRSELGAGWEARFKTFEHEAAAAASLGQVHRAAGLDGRDLACKLQYPDMLSAVEADLQQLKIRSEEHTSELQSLMRISYAVFCLKKKKQYNKTRNKCLT